MKLDPLNITNAFIKATNQMLAVPRQVVDNNLELAKAYSQLWNNVIQKMLNSEIASLYKNDPKDRRFKDESWEKSPLFNFIKQSYLLHSLWLRSIVGKVDDLDSRELKRLDFYSRALIDAMAPTNFFFTNPEVLKETAKTNGENLFRGVRNFFNDLGHGKISTTDFNAFSVGKNLAVTPGKVVFQNDLMQLIQYNPSTKKVYETPLLIFPAWINKYYILDLQAEHSFIRWLVSKGYTVFIVSWINPTKKHADKTFDSYMLEGALEAIEQVQNLSRHRDIHAMGYCLGGTLLAATVAWLKAQKAPCSVKTVTFLATLVDFQDSGDLGVFIDEEQLNFLEKRMSEKGYMDDKQMAATFAMIRANDMIWSFYVNNYMMGRDPLPFDILYWNADSTRLPAKMHSFYLRNMYLKNLLVKPNGITLCQTPIDLGRIDIPAYILSTLEDHIAPWTSTYRATKVYKGATRFVLSASGHVAGVVNHPDKHKYNYWVNNKLVAAPEQWLKNAKSIDGSWWLDWDAWASKQSGQKIAARKVTKGLEDAPGSFVKM